MNADTKRSVDDIQKEYAQLCTKAGHLQYQLHAVGKDLELVNQQLRDLNFEAAKVVAETPKDSENAKS